MNISETPIWSEIQRILAIGAKPVHFEYKCEIYLPDINKTIKPASLELINVHRDYNSNIGDIVKITVKLGKGTFDNIIYLQKENIIITIYKYPIGESESSETNDPYETYVYRGVIVDDTSGTIEGDTPLAGDTEKLDSEIQEDYEFQLIDRAIEQLRYISVGGIFLDIVPGDCLRGLLTVACSKLEGLSEDEEMLGVDMVEPTNLNVREHCVVPHGIPATKLADFIQEEEGGIYSFGMGTYIQNKMWYIYPNYHLKRFSEEPRNLVLLNVPENQLPGIERTYFTAGGKLIVISTGETTHVDDTNAEQMNQGNGVRYAIGSKMIPYSNGPLNYDIPFRNITPMGRSYIPSVNRDDNTEEFIFTPRNDDLNMSPLSDRRITDNHYNEESKLCGRFGGHVFSTWENSDPDLIYPGMPAKYIYMDGDEIVELAGVVMGNSHKIVKKGSGLMEKRYVAASQVHLFVESIPK